MHRVAAIVALTTLLSSGARAADLTPREQAALDLIPFHWQKLKFEIVFLGPRPGVRAMTFSEKHRIEIYARPQDTVRLLAYDIAHELGHAVDVTTNTSETRKRWMELRGIDPATPWFGCDRCSDFATPSGDFAETFALILFGPKEFRGRIAPPPTAKEMPALVSFFDNILD
jgi:hypothetical protein